MDQLNAQHVPRLAPLVPHLVLERVVEEQALPRGLKHAGLPRPHAQATLMFEVEFLRIGA